MHELKLRDYQQRICTDVRTHWGRGDRRLVVSLPTGGGKTEIAAALAKSEVAVKGHTLFIVERKTLAAQAAARFAKYGMVVSILRGEDTIVRGYEPVTVASIQTLSARAEHDDVAATLGKVSLVIIDEAHIRYRAHDDVLASLSRDLPVVGLTATPLRDGLGLAYDDLVRGPSYEQMIAGGHLVQPRYFLPHDGAFDRALALVNVSSTGDFVGRDLSELMRQKVIVGDVVSTWRAKAEGRPTICFAVDKAHARELADAFRSDGVQTGYVDDRTADDERRALFKAFRASQIRVLVSLGVLSIGFDEPSAACAILARPTLSLALHIQQVGRVMRPYDHKDDCLVLDHAGNVLRHGRIEDFDPPALSELDKHSDRKKRTDAATDFYPCAECKVLMERQQRVCPECGHERARPHSVLTVDGDLTERPHEAEQLAELQRMRDLYQQLLGHCDACGGNRGSAYHKLREHYEFKSPWHWRDLPAKDPTPETQRLIQSWNIAYRKAREKQAKKRLVPRSGTGPQARQR